MVTISQNLGPIEICMQFIHWFCKLSKLSIWIVSKISPENYLDKSFNSIEHFKLNLTTFSMTEVTLLEADIEYSITKRKGDLGWSSTHPRLGRVEKLLVFLCYRNWRWGQSDGSLGSYPDIMLPFLIYIFSWLTYYTKYKDKFNYIKFVLVAEEIDTLKFRIIVYVRLFFLGNFPFYPALFGPVRLLF